MGQPSHSLKALCVVDALLRVRLWMRFCVDASGLCTFFFLERDYKSPGRRGGYGTCALAHRARPIRNIEWRLEQDVNRRSFAMQQGVSRRCHNLPHQFLWSDSS